jgi:WD40 repeat protein
MIRSNNSKLLVYSDIGGLKLSRYPLFTTQQKYIELCYHTSIVSGICFDNNDKYIISLGSQDGCIIKWKVEEN